jgi:hypothetical protein
MVKNKQNKRNVRLCSSDVGLCVREAGRVGCVLVGEGVVPGREAKGDAKVPKVLKLNYKKIDWAEASAPQSIRIKICFVGEEKEHSK